MFSYDAIASNIKYCVDFDRNLNEISINDNQTITMSRVLQNER